MGDSLEIPALSETRKVKSIQMFRVRYKLKGDPKKTIHSVL